MTEFETVLMDRDGFTEEEAKQKRKEASEEIEDILSNGGSYDEVEMMLLDFYGLEMDYIFDLL